MQKQQQAWLKVKTLLHAPWWGSTYQIRVVWDVQQTDDNKGKKTAIYFTTSSREALKSHGNSYCKFSCLCFRMLSQNYPEILGFLRPDHPPLQ